MAPVPRQERSSMLEYDSRDETVAHPDRLATHFESPPHPGGPIGSGGVQGEGRDSAQKLLENLELPWRPCSREQLETCHDRRLQRATLKLGGDDTRKLVLAFQEIDQDIGVGDRHLQGSLRARVPWHSSSASASPRLPRSRSAPSRFFSSLERASR